MNPETPAILGNMKKAHITAKADSPVVRMPKTSDMLLRPTNVNNTNREPAAISRKTKYPNKGTLKTPNSDEPFPTGGALYQLRTRVHAERAIPSDAKKTVFSRSRDRVIPLTMDCGTMRLRCS